MSASALRLIRYTGDPWAGDDPGLCKALAAGRIPLPVAEALERFQRMQHLSLIPGQTEVILGPEHGFSRTYVFGPTQYAVWMEPSDAALVLDNEWDRWRFLDITDAPHVTRRPPLGSRGWRQLLASFARLTPQRTLPGENGADFRREFRRRLAK